MALTNFSFLSLHDALPISVVVHFLRRINADDRPEASFAAVGPSGTHGDLPARRERAGQRFTQPVDVVNFLAGQPELRRAFPDRKSTRLNSSHANISYAVFC